MTVATPRVVIISLRGTRALYLSDWMTDITITKTESIVGSKIVKFHTGFYRAITECLEYISAVMEKRFGHFAPPLPVYITGHSLGGAMAAIAYALDGKPFSSKYNYGRVMRAPLGAFSSYSIGMPRYGNIDAILSLPSPYHIYNDKDVVPGVPPRWLGFENALGEYRVDHHGNLILEPQASQGFKWWMTRIHLVRGFRQHLIEQYIHRLRKVVK